MFQTAIIGSVIYSQVVRQNQDGTLVCSNNAKFQVVWNMYNSVALPLVSTHIHKFIPSIFQTLGFKLNNYNNPKKERNKKKTTKIDDEHLHSPYSYFYANLGKN